MAVKYPRTKESAARFVELIRLLGVARYALAQRAVDAEGLPPSKELKRRLQDLFLADKHDLKTIKLVEGQLAQVRSARSLEQCLRRMEGVDEDARGEIELAAWKRMSPEDRQRLGAGGVIYPRQDVEKILRGFGVINTQQIATWLEAGGARPALALTPLALERARVEATQGNVAVAETRAAQSSVQSAVSLAATGTDGRASTQPARVPPLVRALLAGVKEGRISLDEAEAELSDLWAKRLPSSSCRSGRTQANSDARIIAFSNANKTPSSRSS